jgi:hypothetical protein
MQSIVSCDVETSQSQLCEPQIPLGYNFYEPIMLKVADIAEQHRNSQSVCKHLSSLM